MLTCKLITRAKAKALAKKEPRWLFHIGTVEGYYIVTGAELNATLSFLDRTVLDVSLTGTKAFWNKQEKRSKR